MGDAECVTILIFRDGKKKVERTLDEFIYLQKGDTISLSHPLDTFDSSIKNSKMSEGAYAFQKVNRIYNERGGPGGLLKIEYHLSRLDE